MSIAISSPDEDRKDGRGGILGARAVGYGLAVLGIGLAALGIRLLWLGTQPLWQDEAATVRFAGNTLAHLWGPTAALEPNPPLYYTIQHFWVQAFGTSEFAMRLPSAIAGTLAVLVWMAIARTVLGTRAALAFGLLAAASGVLVAYAQEARAYALIMLASSLALLATIKAVDAGREDRHAAGWFALYAVATAAAFYLHNTLGLLPVVCGVVFLLRLFAEPGPRVAPLAGWVVANAAAGLACLWWGLALARQVQGMGGSFWVEKPTPHSVLTVLENAFGVGMDQHPRAGLALSVVLWVLALAGVWRARRERGFLALVLPVALGVPALVLGISLWRSIWLERTLSWALPALLLCAAAAVTRTRGLMRAGIAAALALVSAAGLYKTFVLTQKEPWRDAAALVAATRHPGEPVFFSVAEVEMPFTYYYGGADPAMAAIALPGAPAYLDWVLAAGTVPIVSLEAARSVAAARGRFWLVTSDYGAAWNDPDRRIAATLGEGFALAGHTDLGHGVEIFEWRRAGAGS